MAPAVRSPARGASWLQCAVVRSGDGHSGPALSTAQRAPALARSLWSWLWLWLVDCRWLAGCWLHTGSWLTVALARSLARWVSAGACNNSSTPVYPPFSLQNIGQKWV